MEELTMFKKVNRNRPVEYGYGPDWVGMAMYMDDFPRFYTEEEAKNYWETKLKKEQEEYEQRRREEYKSEAASYNSLIE